MKTNRKIAIKITALKNNLKKAKFTNPKNLIADTIYHTLITASKEFMFHGTSSKFLRKILKKGLYFDEKNRVWSDEIEDNYHNDRESYPGVYFTKNFMTAYSAAGNAFRKFGGDRVIIVAQIETRSPQVVIDEDSVKYNLERIGSKNLVENDWLLLEYILDPEAYFKWEEAWDNFKVTLLYDRFHYPKKIDNIFPLFKEIAFQYLLYKASFLKEDRLLYDNREKLKKIKEKYNLKDARKKFRKLFDTFLRKMNFLANLKEEEKGSNFSLHSIRITEPVNYRGSNRILCVVIIKDRDFDTDEPNKIKIVYSKSKEAEEMVLDNFGKSIGSFEVV